jgi:hypothetical protein
MQFKRKAKRCKEKVRTQPAVKSPVKNGFGYQMPPERIVVDIYFDQKGYPEEAGAFFKYYDKADWSSCKGTPYRNWKLLASDWIYNYEQAIKLERRLRTNALATRGF